MVSSVWQADRRRAHKLSLGPNGLCIFGSHALPLLGRVIGVENLDLRGLQRRGWHLLPIHSGTTHRHIMYGAGLSSYTRSCGCMFCQDKAVMRAIADRLRGTLYSVKGKSRRHRPGSIFPFAKEHPRGRDLSGCVGRARLSPVPHCRNPGPAAGHTWLEWGDQRGARCVAEIGSQSASFRRTSPQLSLLLYLDKTPYSRGKYNRSVIVILQPSFFSQLCRLIPDNFPPSLGVPGADSKQPFLRKPHVNAPVKPTFTWTIPSSLLSIR